MQQEDFFQEQKCSERACGRGKEDMSREIIVIGGGPGGYFSAIRAAQLGASVTLIERDTLGGTCLNRGCIPTKVFAHAAELFQQVKKAHAQGVHTEKISVDWEHLQSYKTDVVTKLTSGVERLLIKNKVTVINGMAEFVGTKKMRVTSAGGEKKEHTADIFIIASGSEVSVPVFPGCDLPGIMTSDEILTMNSLPKSLLLVGGGVIGIEFASIFSSLGVRVLVVEMLPEILPNIDDEMVRLLKGYLAAQGVEFMTSSMVSAISEAKDGYDVQIVQNAEDGKQVEFFFEKVMLCVGRRPNTKKLNLASVPIQTERGKIVVNEKMQTNIPHIFAVGDCASKIMLAHVASKEGEVAAQNAMGIDTRMSYERVPSCVYSAPELASVGMSEAQAKEQNMDVLVGRFPLSSNGKCLAMNQTEGLIKIVADKTYGEVLGVHILGPRATDLIAQGTLAMEAEATVDTMIEMIHAHPTISEGIGEAARDIYGRAIHR